MVSHSCRREESWVKTYCCVHWTLILYPGGQGGSKELGGGGRPGVRPLENGVSPWCDPVFTVSVEPLDCSTGRRRESFWVKSYSCVLWTLSLCAVARGQSRELWGGGWPGVRHLQNTEFGKGRFFVFLLAPLWSSSACGRRAFEPGPYM